MLVSFPMKGPSPPPCPRFSRDPLAAVGRCGVGWGNQGVVFLPPEPSRPMIHGMAGRVWAREVDWQSCPLTLPGWGPEGWGFHVSWGAGVGWVGQGLGSLGQDRSASPLIPAGLQEQVLGVGSRVPPISSLGLRFLPSVARPV